MRILCEKGNYLFYKKLRCRKYSASIFINKHIFQQESKKVNATILLLFKIFIE